MESKIPSQVTANHGQMPPPPRVRPQVGQSSQLATTNSLEQPLRQSLCTLVKNGISSGAPSGLWFKLGVIAKYRLEGEPNIIEGQGASPLDFEQTFGASRQQIRTWIFQEIKLEREASATLRQLIVPGQQQRKKESKLLLAAVCYWKLNGKGPIISTHAGIGEHLYMSEDKLNQCLEKACVMVDHEEQQMVDRRLSVGPPAEPELEDHLAEVFLQKTQQGQLPTKDWMMAEGKRWFEETHPDRIFMDPVTGDKVYKGFNFTSSWLEKFRVRKNLDFSRKRKLIPTIPESGAPMEEPSTPAPKMRRLTGTKLERLDSITAQERRDSIFAMNNAIQLALPRRKSSAIAHRKSINGHHIL